MRVIVIPDVHQKINRLDYILNSFKWDRCVCCGDFLDPKGEPEATNIKTAEYVKKNLFGKSNIDVLMGNHDASYIYYKNEYLVTQKQQWGIVDEINSLFKQEDFKLYSWADSFLITHAGLSKGLLEALSNQKASSFTKETLSKLIDVNVKKAQEQDIPKQCNPVVFGVGWSRNGCQRYGGILWSDFEDEFSPLTGFNQIFGHSLRRDRNPEVLIKYDNGTIRKYNKEKFHEHTSYKSKPNSFNYCIDTCLEHVAIVEDDKISIHKVKYEQK
jgi:hypothetical protein